MSETKLRTGRIHDAIPGLMWQQGNLHDAGLEAVGIVLPAAWHPSEAWDGTVVDGSTLLGLPITWGDRVGLIV